MAMYNRDLGTTIWSKLFLWLAIPLFYLPTLLLAPGMPRSDIAAILVFLMSGCLVFTAGYVVNLLENKAKRLERLNKPLDWVVYSCPYCGQEFDQTTCDIHERFLCGRCHRYYLFYDILSEEAYLDRSTKCSSKSEDAVAERLRELENTTSDECPWCGSHFDPSGYKSDKIYSCPDCSRRFVCDHQRQFRRFRRRIAE